MIALTAAPRVPSLFGSLLLLFVGLACGGGSDEASTSGRFEGQEPARSARVVHVHGLGINPKDGALYAATHTGMFLIKGDGTAQRVGDSFQDTMGFTVVGSDQFLGSGHPDLRDYQAGRWPPLIGLVRSDDAGKTWRSLSLKGQADFHGLRVAHGRVYGFDATGGAFMVSKDGGKNWDTKSKISLLDFAVSPVDPELVIATTGRGVMKSSDGGGTWQASGSQTMTLISWPESGKLWGFDARGVVYLSGDRGTSWAPQGSLPGVPEAVLDAGQSLYVAVQEQGIFLSQDGGKSWSPVYRDAV